MSVAVDFLFAAIAAFGWFTMLALLSPIVSRADQIDKQAKSAWCSTACIAILAFGAQRGWIA